MIEKLEELPPDLKELLDKLRALKAWLDDAVYEKFKRVNPFMENIADWDAKGSRYGEDVTIYDSTTIHGEVWIGDRVWVGPFCTLDGTGRLTIGSGSVVSSGARLLTHSAARHTATGGRRPVFRAPISIGSHTFIGVGAVIMPGVTIGAHCIVGANAVVLEDVPNWTIVAGVPAKRIGDVEL